MSLILTETNFDYLLTDEILLDEHERAVPCLEIRNVIWRYSLLATDRDRMICTFDAPDAESVRESYRKAALHPRPTWSGHLIQPEGLPLPQNLTPITVVEISYSTLNEEDLDKISHHLSNTFAEHSIEWLRAYLSRDRARLICELNTPDIECVRHIQNELSVTCDRIWSACVVRD